MDIVLKARCCFSSPAHRDAHPVSALAHLPQACPYGCATCVGVSASAVACIECAPDFGLLRDSCLRECRLFLRL
jgi:hypothetical protein